MKLAGCFNGTKTSYMPKDQGIFYLSCHDPFKEIHFHPVCELCKEYFEVIYRGILVGHIHFII